MMKNFAIAAALAFVASAKHHLFEPGPDARLLESDEGHYAYYKQCLVGDQECSASTYNADGSHLPFCNYMPADVDHHIGDSSSWAPKFVTLNERTNF